MDGTEAGSVAFFQFDDATNAATTRAMQPSL